jgi:hypothetical protein
MIVTNYRFTEVFRRRGSDFFPRNKLAALLVA